MSFSFLKLGVEPLVHACQAGAVPPRRASEPHLLTSKLPRLALSHPVDQANLELCPPALVSQAAKSTGLAQIILFIVHPGCLVCIFPERTLCRAVLLF